MTNKFIYESYSWKIINDNLEIVFLFKIEPDITFSPTLVIKNVPQEMADKLGDEKINSYVFNIGLSEMFSYWKCTASQNIDVQAGKLDQEQIVWWHKLLIKGMGEFFFVNNIDFTKTDFVKIESNSERTHQILEKNLVGEEVGEEISEHNQNSKEQNSGHDHIEKILIPVGGGKDSSVTLEILGNLAEIGTFVVNPTQAALDLISAKDISVANNLTGSSSDQKNPEINKNNEEIEVSRTIDPKLLELNKQGYLNGHVPISAFFAFLSVFSADLFGYSHVAISNERSSNEGNVQFFGQEINHQYSKTYEFEKDFQDYVKKYLPGSAPLYFSFLRPLYELQIAKIFSGNTKLSSGMKKYHRNFRSCNRGQKTNSWCGECSKCLFAYIIIHPFIDNEKIHSYFGKDMLDDEKLWPTAQELLGVGAKKPLECVGTHEETIVAFYLSIKKYLDNGSKLPALLEMVNQNLISSEESLESRTQTILNSWNEDNSVPEALAEELKKYNNEDEKKSENVTEAGSEAKEVTLDEKFKLIILGLGQEGLSSYQFLREKYPNKKMFLIDEKQVDDLGDEWQKISENDENVEFATGFDSIKQNINSENNSDKILVIKSPGLSSNNQLVIQAKELGSQFTSNTNMFFELLETLNSKDDDHDSIVKTIGVTGTKGKSTTASMIYHVLHNCGIKTFLGGNIGIPPLSLWKDIKEAALTKPTEEISVTGITNNETTNEKPVYVVLEMSCHQLSDLSFSPSIAVILDISPEHLDYYNSFDEYVEAKSQISRFQTENDLVIFNNNQEIPANLANLGKARQISFGLDEYEDIINAGQLPVIGKHNILNSIPSIIIAKELGCSTSDIINSLKTFKPLAHRLEIVKNSDGITYVNDSLSTTPKSTIAAIESFNNSPIILIAGGYDRNLDFSELAGVMNNSNIKHLILLPDTGEKILRAVGENQKQLRESEKAVLITEHTFANNMKEAVEAAKSVAKEGDIILLSPAAASFGHFKDYQDRGDQFRKFVNE